MTRKLESGCLTANHGQDELTMKSKSAKASGVDLERLLKTKKTRSSTQSQLPNARKRKQNPHRRQANEGSRGE